MSVENHKEKKKENRIKKSEGHVLFLKDNK